MTPVTVYLGDPDTVPAALEGVERMYLAPLPPTLEVTLHLARRLAESLGAVGIRALADHQDGRVLMERHGGVQRGDRRFADHRSLGAIQAGHGGSYRSDVSRGGTASTAERTRGS